MSDPSRAIFVQDLIPFHTFSSVCVLQFILIPRRARAGAVSLDRWNDGKCTLLIPLGPKKKRIAAAFSLHTTDKHFFTTAGRRICRPSSRRQRGSGESSVVLGRTNAQQRSRRNERDHLKFMRAKWYSTLHPAPLVAFITGAGTELEKGRRGKQNRRWDRILIQGPSRWRFAVAPSYRAPPSLPSLRRSAGEMGRDHKNPRAGVSSCHRCL